MSAQIVSLSAYRFTRAERLRNAGALSSAARGRLGGKAKARACRSGGHDHGRCPTCTGRDNRHLETARLGLDQAIHEVIFTDARGGTPTLGVLIGMLKTPGAIPPKARQRAEKILTLVGTHGSAAAKLSEDEKIRLGNELLQLLRFVCHRGNYP